MKRRTKIVLFSVLGFIGVLAAVIAALLLWPAWPAPVVASRPADAPPATVTTAAQPLPGKLAITRVAHASVLLDFDGAQVLTDPWFTEKEEYHHGEPLGFAIKDLPKLTAVVVSHEHYDHYDIDAFAAYPDKSVPMFVATKDMASDARDKGFTNVRALEPWQSAQVGALTITAAPGAHGTYEVTYVIQGNGNTVFFGGDSKLIPPLETELPKRFPTIDVALLPVNGLHAGGKPVVMNDKEAAKLAGELHPAVAIPIHYKFHAGIIYDTVALSYHGTAEGFVQAMKASSSKADVRILLPGQRLEIVHAAAAASEQPR